jgi:hypothetical protein
MLTGCSGSAVKIRHCPATVSDLLGSARSHCLSGREGADTMKYVASQETGSAKPLCVRSSEGEGGR